MISFGFKYGIPVDADFVADMRFLPNPYWVPELRGKTGRAAEVSDYVLGQHGRPEFVDALRRAARRASPRATSREGKRFMSVAIGCTGGKHRSVAMTEEIARQLREAGLRRLAGPPRPRARVTWTATDAPGHRPRRRPRAARLAVRAPPAPGRRLTAVVTVADDGGSSGRLRSEFGVLPPGDLRMALAALCGDDEWGETWARVLQHRFAGTGEMRGHVVGNLLIVSLWELLGDHVEALDWVGRLLGARGRVLPMALTPLDITAEVSGLDPADPDALTTVRGQVAVATSHGTIESISLLPPDLPAVPEAVAAIRDADLVVLGPGSWFTSVLPHLMVPALRRGPRPRPTPTSSSSSTWRRRPARPTGFGAADHLAVLLDHAPDLTARHRARRPLAVPPTWPSSRRWPAKCGARLSSPTSPATTGPRGTTRASWRRRTPRSWPALVETASRDLRRSLTDVAGSAPWR